MSSATRLVPGMLIVAAGVNAGTTVISISGTTVTMSEKAAAGSTGTVLSRFCLFDVEAAGASGGDWLRPLVNANLPVSRPDGTTTVDPAAISFERYQNLAAINFGDGGSVSTLANLWQGTQTVEVDPAASSLTVTTTNPGGGRPLPQLPPMRVGTYYLKL